MRAERRILQTLAAVLLPLWSPVGSFAAESDAKGADPDFLEFLGMMIEVSNDNDDVFVDPLDMANIELPDGQPAAQAQGEPQDD